MLVGFHKTFDEEIGGDDVVIEAAKEDARTGGDHVDYVGGGGAFGAEEEELGEEDLVGIAEEDAAFPFDDGADLGD